MRCGRWPSSLAAETVFANPFTSTLIELGIFISHGIWLLRTRSLRREAAGLGVDFDAYPKAVDWEKAGFKLGLFERHGSNVEQAV